MSPLFFLLFPFFATSNCNFFLTLIIALSFFLPKQKLIEKSNKTKCNETLSCCKKKYVVIRLNSYQNDVSMQFKDIIV